MAYTPHQQAMISLARRLSRNDTPIVQRALLEAMAVESNFRNIKYGDRDSVGVLQQRPSQGWGPASETPAQDINQFLTRARRNSRGFRGTAGQLAQSVQRSAFPGRYDQRERQANELLGGKIGKGKVATIAPAPPAGGGSMFGGAREVLLNTLVQRNQAFISGREEDAPSALEMVQAVRAAGAMQGSAQPTSGSIKFAAQDGTRSPREKSVVQLAQQYLGTPYSWGGGGPGGPSKGFGRGANTVGFDCSSFLQFVWAKQGVKIPRVTYDQWRAGSVVNKKSLRPGDAVFFRPGQRGPEHVGMYIGGGKFIEAPGTGKTIRVSNLSGRSDFMGARRFG